MDTFHFTLSYQIQHEEFRLYTLVDKSKHITFIQGIFAYLKLLKSSIMIVLVGNY